MNETTQIIAAYKNGDFEKRLNLFLSHRSLRDQFAEIDYSEKGTQAECGAAANRHVKNRSFFQRLLLRWI